MAPSTHYKNLESKWAREYPSTKDAAEVWSFYEECGYQDPQKTLKSILDKAQWNKERVLDLGCDTGFMLKFICDNRPSLHGFGIDINTRAIEQAKSRFPEFQFETFDGLTLPFPGKHFDLVFVSAVVKHVRYEDRSHVYGEIKRVANQVFFIEADSKQKEEVAHGSWTFYNSHFEKEFQEHFEPISVVHEAGDLLGLYSCQ